LFMLPMNGISSWPCKIGSFFLLAHAILIFTLNWRTRFLLAQIIQGQEVFSLAHAIPILFLTSDTTSRSGSFFACACNSNFHS
jgi:hypothetical protein